MAHRNPSSAISHSQKQQKKTHKTISQWARAYFLFASFGNKMKAIRKLLPFADGK